MVIFEWIPLHSLRVYSLWPCCAGQLVSAVAVVCACPRDNDNPTQLANSNFLLLNITFKCTSGTEKVSSFRVKIRIRYYIHFNILLNSDIEENIFLYFRYVDYDSSLNVRKSWGYIIWSEQGAHSDLFWMKIILNSSSSYLHSILNLPPVSAG